ncbi:hypothetical protein K2X89_08745, partial [Myxococcota bacterium]|nr:hypothetical protein [Myxococcota bacterium]
DSTLLGGPVKSLSIIPVVLLSLALAGCADLVFKPGASAADMQRDELACRDQHSDEAGYQACMAERGYRLAHTEGALDWTPASR